MSKIEREGGRKGQRKLGEGERDTGREGGKEVYRRGKEAGSKEEGREVHSEACVYICVLRGSPHL